MKGAEKWLSIFQVRYTQFYFFWSARGKMVERGEPAYCILVGFMSDKGAEAEVLAR